MIRYPCIHCQHPIEVPDSMQGQSQICSNCNGRTIVPVVQKPGQGQAARPQPSSPSTPGYVQSAPVYAAPPQQVEATAVGVPMLISAIINLMMGLVWALTCIGIILTIPLIILGIFEIIVASQILARKERVTRGKATAIGICEIIAGLLSLSLIPTVCGIIVLCNQSKLPQN